MPTAHISLRPRPRALFPNLICHLNHCGADDGIAELIALLKDISDHVFALGFVFNMHYCFVKIGIELLPYRADLGKTEL